MGRGRAKIGAIALVTLIALVSLGALTTVSPAESLAPSSQEKNVLLILTDDQPYRSSVQRMEAVNALDAVRFEEAFTNNPVCCPSRATMLTGLYDHHTRVTTNHTGHRFDDASTIAAWFDDAGYRTGLFGKYLNGYPFGRGPEYVPPGWDEWQAFIDDGTYNDGYYDYALSENGQVVPYGSEDTDYSTDVLAAKVEQFVASSPDPFLAVLSANAPHHPATPAPRHEGKFAAEDVKLPLNFNRIGAHPPRWVRRLTPKDPEVVKGFIRRQWETLEAVDEAVGSIAGRLEEIGELDETVIVYVSDNGLSLGSHRWRRKTCGYDECGHVPMLVAAPGIPGRAEDALVSNVDLAPTLADLGGISLPDVDGESLAPIMRGSSTSLQRPVLLHNVFAADHVNAPSYRGIRTRRWKFIAYTGGGERELYDLRVDPLELRNLAGKPRMESRIRRLENRIRELRG